MTMTAMPGVDKKIPHRLGCGINLIIVMSQGGSNVFCNTRKKRWMNFSAHRARCLCRLCVIP